LIVVKFMHILYNNIPNKRNHNFNMRLEPTMFRKYDIRGRVSDAEFNEKSVEAIAKGFGTMLRKRGVETCVCAYDNRAYSKGLTEVAMAGLASTGVSVRNIGLATVPVAYWAQYFLKIKGVCMGTASHNPNGWFGLKLGFDYTSTLVEEEIRELYSIIEREEFQVGQGAIETVDGVIEAYQEDVVGRATLHRPLTVVVNCGNGTAGPINVPVLEKLGVKVIGQFIESDPTFPNHEPNPSLVEFQRALSSKVLETKADLGIGFDADGDRLGLIDNLGQSFFSDKAFILLTRLALEKEPGAKIVFDVKSTQALIDDIKAHGGVPVMWKTGHSFIKAKAKEVDAALGGERSGHIFVRRGYYGYDDALMAALKFLEYVSGQSKTVAELHDEVSTYAASPEIKAHCADEIKEQVVARIVQELKQEFGPERVIDIDGARVDFGDGWGLVRYSSNLPELVLVFEAKTKERMREIKELFRARLQKHPEVGPFENE